MADTREQAQLNFLLDDTVTEVRRQCLPLGDYQALYTDGTLSPIVVERKSLNDLFGTMTSGYPRFKQRLLEARERQVTMVLGIEGTIGDILEGCPYSTYSGASCLQKIHTLFLRYGLIPLYAANRTELARGIVEIFKAYGRVYKVKT